MRAGLPLVASESTALRYAQLDPDVRLMLRVRDDDAAAFEELVCRYQGRLLTVLRHLGAGPEQAEDVAQEVFLRVFRARKQYVPGAKFSTWLFTIANNVASNARRSLARRREVQVHASDSGAMAARPLEQLALEASGQMPTRRVASAEAAQLVRMAIESLNDRQRLAVLLCKFEDMSYADIAEIMELSPQAVKSLLSRARTQLRAALEPYMEAGPPAPEMTDAS